MSRWGARQWRTLALLCASQFMLVLDTSIVSVALPAVQDDLGLGQGNLQWVVSAYTLVFGGFLLLGRCAGGRTPPVSRRRVGRAVVLPAAGAGSTRTRGQPATRARDGAEPRKEGVAT